MLYPATLPPAAGHYNGWSLGEVALTALLDSPSSSSSFAPPALHLRSFFLFFFIFLLMLLLLFLFCFLLLLLLLSSKFSSSSSSHPIFPPPPPLIHIFLFFLLLSKFSSSSSSELSSHISVSATNPKKEERKEKEALPLAPFRHLPHCCTVGLFASSICMINCPFAELLRPSRRNSGNGFGWLRPTRRPLKIPRPRSCHWDGGELGEGEGERE